MLSFILTENGFCFNRDGVAEWLEPAQVTALGISSREKVAVFLGGVEYRVASGGASMPLTAGLFPNGFMERQEKMPSGGVLAMGVREALLDVLYGVFSPSQVEVCVPYGLGVRAMLLSRGVALQGAFFMVLDDAGERVFLTVLDGMAVLETREMPYKDTRRLQEEVQRSARHWQERIKASGGCKLATNHSGFIELLEQEEPERDCLQLEGVLPVLDIGARARFGVRFSSISEENSRQSRVRLWQTAWPYIIPAGVSMGVLAGCLGLTAQAQQAGLMLKVKQEELKKTEIRQRQTAAGTYQDRLRFGQPVSLVTVLEDLRVSMPEGWLVRKWEWENDLDRPARLSIALMAGEEGEFKGAGVLQRTRSTRELANGKAMLMVRGEYEKHR